MSRNLELLEQLQQDQELFSVAPMGQAPRSGRKRSSRSLEGCSLPTRRAGLLSLAQRLFWTNVAKDRKRTRRVVFCGIEVGDATSELCVELARVLASQAESLVCVAEGNVHAPQLSRLFGLAPSDVATHGSQVLRPVTDNLWLISGYTEVPPSDPTESLRQLRSQIRGMPPEFDHVIINAPPAGIYPEAALLGQGTDGVVLVLEANRTRKLTARKAKQDLVATGVQVLGAVLNNRTFPTPERIYHCL